MQQSREESSTKKRKIKLDPSLIEQALSGLNCPNGWVSLSISLDVSFFCDRLFLVKPAFASERFPLLMFVCVRERKRLTDLEDETQGNHRSE